MPHTIYTSLVIAIGCALGIIFGFLFLDAYSENLTPRIEQLGDIVPPGTVSIPATVVSFEPNQKQVIIDMQDMYARTDTVRARIHYDADTPIRKDGTLHTLEDAHASSLVAGDPVLVYITRENGPLHASLIIVPEYAL